MYSTRAFPNAYLEVDEPPRRTGQRALAFVGVAGTAYFALTVAALHFEPTGYSPVTQTVSDYGVGAFSVAMALGFFAGGIGMAALALVLRSASAGRRGLRVGSTLLLVAGVVLFLVGLFPTDIEGAPATAHGTAHNVLSLIVFVLAPTGMLEISHAKGRPWFSVTPLALAVAALSLVLDAALALDASGVVERIVITVIFGWVLLTSYSAFRHPEDLAGRSSRN